MKSVCVCAGLLLACAGSVLADTAMVPASRDATLYFSATGSLANGGGTGMFVGRNSQGNTRRTLIGFDVASMIPAGATITGATMTLNVSSANAAADAVSIFRVLADWSEGTSVPANEGQGAASAAGDVTWIHRNFSGQLWTTAGGDFAAGASAVTAVGGIGLYSWSSAAMVSDVQGWLNGSLSNFGWEMLGNETAVSTAKRFDTRTIGTAGIAPVLVVEYTIPAPASAGLIGIAGLAAVRRRRENA